MPKSDNPSNFLPSFLFQEKINQGNHISSQAIIDPKKIIMGENNFFSSLSSPNNKPKKKSLYFDYYSFLFLKSHDEISLVLAKLKLEGFDIFLVFKKNNKIIAQEVDQDLQFKDNYGNNNSIFNLENTLPEIHKPSQIDETLYSLELNSDESLVLSYHQFCEIENSIADNQFLDIGVLQNHSIITLSLGIREEKLFRKDLIYKSSYLINSTDLDFYCIAHNFILHGNESKLEPSEQLKLFFKDLMHFSYYPNFPEHNYNCNFDYTFILMNLFDLLKKIEISSINGENNHITKINPQAISKIFSDLIYFPLGREASCGKDKEYKKIFKIFWFNHPDFDFMISEAKDLLGITTENPEEEIFNSIFNDNDNLCNDLNDENNNFRLFYNYAYFLTKNMSADEISLMPKRIFFTSNDYKSFQILELLKYYPTNSVYSKKDYKELIDPTIIDSISLSDNIDAKEFAVIRTNYPLHDIFLNTPDSNKYQISLDFSGFIILLQADNFSKHHDLLDKISKDIFNKLIIALSVNNESTKTNTKILFEIFSKNPIHPAIKKFEKQLNKVLTSKDIELKDKKSIFSNLISNTNSSGLRIKFIPKLPLETILYCQENGIILDDLEYLQIHNPYLRDPAIKEKIKNKILDILNPNQGISNNFCNPALISLSNFLIDNKIFNNIYLLNILKEILQEKSTKILAYDSELLDYKSRLLLFNKFKNFFIESYNFLTIDYKSSSDNNPNIQDKELIKKIDDRLKIKLAELSDYKLTSPFKLRIINLNQDNIDKIMELSDKENLDIEKILCLELINFDTFITYPTKRQQLFESLIKLFTNLKHLSIDTNLKDLVLSSMAELTSKKLTINFKDLFEDQLTSYLSRKEDDLLDYGISLIRQSTSQKGLSLYIASGNLKSLAQSSSSKSNFKMVEAGKILHRFANSSEKKIYLRSSLKKLNKDTTSLDQDWLNNNIYLEKIPATPTKYSDFESVTNYQINEELKQTHTACYFTQELSSSSLNKLISISPDNEIIRYHVDPSDVLLKFTKDEAGFYFVETNKRCTISYVMQGQELNRYCVSDTESYSPNIDESILDIFNKYVGTNPSDFPISVKYDSYQLPPYDEDERKKNPTTYNQQWLDQLFEIKNKGSCRHRVMAMANAFESARIDPNKFRIVEINNSHLLIEVKGKDNLWNSIDFGGAQVDLSYDLVNKYSSSISKEVSSLDKPLSNIQSPQSQSLVSSQTQLKLEELYQLKNIGNIEDLTGVLFSKNNQAFLLITDNYHDLKNYLLNFSVNTQLQYLADSSHRASNYDRKSFLVVDDPLELSNSDKRIVIDQSTQQPKINNYSKLEEFFDYANTNSSVILPLIFDYSKFSAKDRVAFNTMFDQGNRSINGLKIPDNVLIICIDDHTKEITDPSVLSRFNSAFDLSDITSKDLKNHQYQKPSDSLSDSKIKEIIEFNFDFEGFEDWQQKLMGRLVVDNDQIIWQKSQFVKDLEENSTSGKNPSSADLSKIFNINFNNISQENIKKLQEFFAEAISLGYIDFYGYKIRITQEINLKFPSQKQGNFAFSNILKDFAYLKNQEPDRAGGEIDRDRDRDRDRGGNEVEELVIHKKTSANQKPSLKIYKDQLASSRLPIDIHFINSQIFDQLITIPKVEGEKYYEEIGLIEKASQQADRTLKLFISEELSAQQSYCLISLARKHNVSLKLYLAKEALIKNQEFSKFYVREICTEGNEGLLDQSEIEIVPVVSSPLSYHLQSLLRASTQLTANSLRIIVSNNLDQASDELVSILNTTSREINLVNVEDVLYQDLFESSDCKIERSSDQTSSSQGSQFVIKILKTVSQIQEKLGNSKLAIIIKGKFPKELLSLLQPQILDIKRQFQNLYFVIEEDIKTNSNSSIQLSWLDKSSYQIKHYQTQAKSKTPVLREPYPVVAEISDNPLQSANEFITKRKELLANCLKDNSLVKIVGHSGVGKSSLFDDIKKFGLTNQTPINVYHELTDIEKFANDKTDGTLKILVIDEFNIDGSLNWTMLRDFANCSLSDQSANAQNNRKLFYKGKFYQLNSYHRIVFLGNPKSYGNRYEHQLFKEQNIAELHLQDFSIDYIYQTLLREPIFFKLKDFVKEVIGDGDLELAEKNFKDICLKAIKKYKRLNQKQSDDGSDLPTQTVRELQEEVLKEISKKLTQDQEHPASQSQSREFKKLTTITKRVTDIASKDFIATQANYDSLEQLAQAIRIRQLQKHDLLPDRKLGTNGIIFEGDSGVGKSVMIEALLYHQGITKIDNLDDYRHSQDYCDQQHRYYKLPASLSYQEIEKQLIKAYELGVVVIFDEINTRLNEGLEKIINNLLTGHYHQEKSSFNSDQSFTPSKGFMLIGSINSVRNKGRTSISAAIQHRSNIIKANSLRGYQVADFEKIIVNWLEQSSIQEQQRSKEIEGSLWHPISLPKRDNNLSEITAIAQEFKDCCSHNPKYNLRALKEKLQEILQDKYSHETLLSDEAASKYQSHKFEASYIHNYRDDIFGFKTTQNNPTNPDHFFRNNQITNQNISTKNEEIKENIFSIFDLLKRDLNLSNEELTLFYLLANKYKGLGNVISSSNSKIKDDFFRLFGNEDHAKIRKAIKFSAFFQNLANQKNFKTGNLSDNYLNVGMRLKRIDPALFQEYLIKDCKTSAKKELVNKEFFENIRKVLDKQQSEKITIDSIRYSSSSFTK